jgi:hypothetical protein
MLKYSFYITNSIFLNFLNDIGYFKLLNDLKVVDDNMIRNFIGDNFFYLRLFRILKYLRSFGRLFKIIKNMLNKKIINWKVVDSIELNKKVMTLLELDAWVTPELIEDVT